MLRKTLTGPSPPDKHTEGPDMSTLLAAANYTLVKADDADEKKFPQEPMSAHQLKQIFKPVVREHHLLLQQNSPLMR